MPFATLSMFHVASVLAAAATAIAVFRVLPGTEIEKPAFVGLCVLMLGILLAEGAARRMERRVLLKRLDAERNARRAQGEAIEALNARIAKLGSGGDSSDLVAEMRLVRSQLAKLSEAGTARSGEKAVTSAPDVRLSGNALLKATTEALRENRIDLYLQPVVRLPQRRSAFHECLTRLRDDQGRIITPDQYMPIAEEAGMTSAIDNLSLFRCVQTLKARRGPDVSEMAFFCNLSASTLEDSDFFAQFADFLKGNADLAGRIVFEIEAARMLSATGKARTHLDALTMLGFRLSADHVTSLDTDLSELARRGASFIKIDCDPLIHDSQRSAGAVREALGSAGVNLVATKVETEDQVVELVEADVRLAQGYLFGEPRPMRDDA